MTEDEARRWVADRYPANFGAIETFLEMVVAENARQNLIAPSTISQIWARHAVDSLQLLSFEPGGGTWVDIGSGGGFPGIIIAICRSAPVVLLEPRRRRADFLRSVVKTLDFTNADVRQIAAERMPRIEAAAISARAVADIERLIALGARWATPSTRWIMPRGQVSDGDMGVLYRHFDKMFHVEQSITSAGSKIVVAEGCPA